MPIELIDSHCHFDFPEFEQTRASQWQACQALGLKALLMPGVSVDQWPKLKALCVALPGLVYGVGVHPWWLTRCTVGNELGALASPFVKDDACVAIGECGLDAKIDAPMNEQIALLEQHLQLASDLLMPLIVHVRAAHRELQASLKRFRLPAGGVIHAYTGSLQQAEVYLKLGFHLGVGGAISYERAKKTRHTFSVLPLESMVLETDAPDMPLEGFQGQPNHPAQLLRVAKTLASLRPENLDAICEQTTYNSRLLFGLGAS